MAFSCNFNAVKQKGKKLWSLTKDDVEWIIEEEWISDYNSYLIPRITLRSSEMDKYYAEMVVFPANENEIRNQIFKNQVLRECNSISVYFDEFSRVLNTYLELVFFKIQINLFPYCHLIMDNMEPIPLKEMKAADETVKPKTEKNLEALSGDMLSLLKDPQLFDVELVSGETIIKAHKIILSARSPVFAKMFSSNMRENLEKRVVISDVSGPVLDNMLFYLYTGTVIFKEHSAVRSLYIASDKYAVLELKEMCASWLKNVTLNTVLDVLSLAETYGDKNMKKESFKFVAMNYSLLKTTESWLSFLQEYPSLSIEVLTYLIDSPRF